MIKEQEALSSRIYPNRPIIGVGGVVVRGEEVLLIRRAHEPAKGAWSIPGGAVHIGETLEDAVKREILEETSISVRVHDVVAVLDRIIPDINKTIKFHYVLIDFLCTPFTNDNPLSGSDAEDGRYVNLSDLDDYELTAVTRDVIEHALRLAHGSNRHSIYFKYGLK